MLTIDPPTHQDQGIYVFNITWGSGRLGIGEDRRGDLGAFITHFFNPRLDFAIIYVEQTCNNACILTVFL